MAGRLAIGVDVGGTKVEGLLVDVSREADLILDRRRVETPALDAEATARTIVSVARDLLAGRSDLIAVGVGTAGMVTLDGVVRYAPNVAWREFPLRERVERETGLPVS